MKTGKELKIGVITAMESEAENFISYNRFGSFNHGKFYSGHVKFDADENVASKEVVLCVSGIGKVNAGVCAYSLIKNYGCNCIINMGVAGACVDRLKIGDVLLSRDSIYHDVDATAVGDVLGQVPNMDTLTFSSDFNLVNKAIDIIKNEYPGRDYLVRLGRIATGDQFVADKSKKEYIANTFVADCIDMEGAAIGQVAYMERIPYIIVRGISDTLGEDSAAEYSDCLSVAANNCREVVRELISRL